MLSFVNRNTSPSSVHFSSVQFSPPLVSDSLRPHGLKQARLPYPLPEIAHVSIVSVMPSNYLILSRPLLLLLSVFPSIRVFNTESVLCIKWPKYWSFSISHSNEYSRLPLHGPLENFMGCFYVKTKQKTKPIHA